ncbi:hypothetical protein D0Z03_001396 [Geotrichum reessii]|nr:hypothetical protein D0Z03_001396 [Galactomyces reessii]
MALPLITFAAAVFVDAGTLTTANTGAALTRYEFDGIIFPAGRADCRTCRRPRPARSKHCGTCGVCVVVADHHCLWLNNCVGQGNYRWFVSFLVANLATLGYGLALIVGIFKAERIVQLAQQQLQHEFLSSPKLAFTIVVESWVGLPGWMDLLLGRNGDDGLRVLFCLALLCASMSMLVAAFLAQHLRYIYLGVTTNESAKWEDVQYAIEDGELFRYAYPTETTTNASNNDDGRNNNKFTPQIVVQIADTGTFNRRLTAAESEAVRDHGLRLVPVTSVAEIDNIYDQGFLANLRHRLFSPPF